jgi:mannose-6-phosphate isomerase-like protein (cupin superfamily)
MRHVVLLVVTLIACGADVHAQRRGRGGLGTFAILVTDPSGAPIPDVLVTVDGPARRTARTEGGRIAFERLPVGSYRLHFEREGFIALDREVTARTGQPIDVKVTLKRVPLPLPAPVPPLPPRPPAADAKPVVLDLPTIIEKEYVGRAPSRSSSLACAAGGSATLLQLNRPLAEHTHTDADEILYVIAGTGTAQIQDRSYALQAGVFAFVPRGMPHSLSATGRVPLTVLSTKAGEPCGAPAR